MVDFEWDPEKEFLNVEKHNSTLRRPVKSGLARSSPLARWTDVSS
jgi:hypothetical protein